MSESAPQPAAASAPHRSTSFARAAGIIALGNVTSRLVGLVRVTLIADVFGASGVVSAFVVASAVPNMIYELLIGGMLSAALVPVFSQVDEQEGRVALGALFSRVASLIAVVLAGLVLLLEILAPQVAWLLGGGFQPEVLAVLVNMIRLITPAVLFFGLSGVVTGLLYALKEFTYPAFGAAVFNLGIVIAVPLLSGRLDAYSLAVGVLLGSFLQLSIQAPGLRNLTLRFRLDLAHPALRRILILYLPIALGVMVANLQIAIDRRLASSTGPSSLAWMANATYLFQLPHGLVAVAISLAVLPTLSRLNAAGDLDGFRQTLGQGLRLALVLILPATLGLLVLARPIVELVFEHGAFTARDTFWTVWALRYYLVGLIFATIDWPLNYSFYARQDTLTPALVGVFSVVVYLAAALSLLKPLGMLGLVLADSAKHISHALTMLILTWRRTGSLPALGLGPAAGKALLASAVMAGLMTLLVSSLTPVFHRWGLPALTTRFLLVAIPGGVGGLAYLALATVLRIEEMGLLRRRLRRADLD